MKLNTILTIILSFLCVSVYTQSVAVKKCQTCGKTLAQCKYMGKHPSPNKPVELSPEQMCAKAERCLKNGDWDGHYKWYKKAAEKGYAKGINGLGICYQFGFGIDKDIAHAIDLFKEASEMGLVEALWNIGSCYGTLGDHEEAFDWYKKSAEKEYAKGARTVGYYYFMGKGTNHNIEEAFKWYEKSAFLDANYGVEFGEFYEKGWGVSKNIEKAKFWYRKAKSAGNYYADEALKRVE